MPKQRVEDDQWRLSDALWSKMEPLIPVPASKHPFILIMNLLRLDCLPRFCLET